MFQTLLCPSSGARDYDIYYHICHVVLGLLYVEGWSSVRAASLSLQPGHYSSLTAPNLQRTTKQERHGPCGKQHHSRELLMMGIVVPETC